MSSNAAFSSTADRSGLRTALLSMRRLETPFVVSMLTLLLLVLYSAEYWDVKVPMAVFCASGMVVRRLAINPYYWAAITVVLMLGTLSRVYNVDNHKVLMSWWCLALTLYHGRRTALPLRVNARLLIGLCFALAVAWKVGNPGYVDGGFFEHTLLSDGRFRKFMHFVTGLSPAVAARNAAAYRDFSRGDAGECVFGSNEAVALLADGLTWWTVAIETLIAMAFLLPERKNPLFRWRNAVMIGFLATTYSVATVIGFGWLLAIMGLAQCRPTETRARIGYLAAFVALQVFLVPWGSVLKLDFRAY